MKISRKYRGKGMSRPRTILSLFAVLALALLIGLACGEAATATPEPAMEEEEAAPTPTAMMEEEPEEEEAMPEPTPTAMMEEEEEEEEAMEETTVRPRSEWTVENPATLEEISAELEKYRGQSIVFASWGGAYQAAQRQAYAVPFTEQFGIEVIDDSQPTLGNVRARSQSGNVTWHLFDTGTGSIHQLSNTGDLEELDFSIIDNRDYLEVTKSPFIGGGGITWSEVWAYNTDVFPADNQPHTMADIYDPEKFPGRRAWAYYPDHEMVFALLSKNPELLDTAEGRASLSALTEEQVDEAFAIFEEYRGQVDWFWQTGSDCPQNLISGEMALCTAWNGRIFDAAKEGEPIRVCWECGHVLNTGVFGIIKGLKEQDPQAFELAQLYMAWTSFPEINARMAQFITYGPINTKSLPFLDGPEYDEVRDELPSSVANIPFAIFKDEVHVGEHTDGWRERWIAFQQTFEN